MEKLPSLDLRKRDFGRPLDHLPAVSDLLRVLLGKVQQKPHKVSLLTDDGQVEWVHCHHNPVLQEVVQGAQVKLCEQLAIKIVVSFTVSDPSFFYH